MLPLRDGVVVEPPLAGLQLDEGGLEVRAEHFARERIAVERLHGLEQSAREGRYTQFAQLLVTLVVHVERDRVARVEPPLDALETGREEHRGREVRVAGRVDRARFDSA